MRRRGKREKEKSLGTKKMKRRERKVRLGMKMGQITQMIKEQMEIGSTLGCDSFFQVPGTDFLEEEERKSERKEEQTKQEQNEEEIWSVRVWDEMRSEEDWIRDSRMSIVPHFRLSPVVEMLFVWINQKDEKGISKWSREGNGKLWPTLGSKTEDSFLPFRFPSSLPDQLEIPSLSEFDPRLSVKAKEFVPTAIVTEDNQMEKTNRQEAA